MRTRLIESILICIFLLLAGVLFKLQVLEGAKFRQLSNKNRVRLLPQSGSRGRILDCEDNVIVDNYLTYDVMVSSEDSSRLDRLLSAVSRILGEPFSDLKRAFKSGFSAPFMPVAVARNIDIQKAGALEELKIDFGGLSIQPRALRRYPYGNLACHVLGYLSEIDRWRLTKLEDYGYNTKDIVGFGGVEEKYDYYLRQEEGGLSIEVDHRGRFMRVLGYKPGHNGRDLQLTLNLKIQKIAQGVLGERKGCVVIMNPYDGALVAMVSSPGFNPASFIDKSSLALSGFFNDSDAPLVNRAISSSFPAGSVFKLVVATAALATGKINLSTSFLCQGYVFVGKQKFDCWNKHGQQNLISAIAHSCNVFFYKSGLLLGAQAIHDYAVKFGLSKPTSVDLPYETGGFIPYPLWNKIYKFRNWFDGDTANLSIGQGDVLVTPLQMARLLAVFANNGYLVRPYIVRKAGRDDISFLQKKIEKIPLNEEVLNHIRQGLRSVVAEPTGTANVLSDLTVSVAGKTGTAQAPPGQSHAWFAGFFPYKNPKFVICVFLEKGGPGYVSSVLTKQIIEAMLEEGLVE